MVGEAEAWQGPNPFYLTIQTAEDGNTVIDLDETGWLTTYAHLLRKPGAWMLNHKAVLQTVAIILVQEGEQPYYTARHIGIAFGGTGEMIAYGIGKKRRDGHVDRLWVLPNGVICAGDDVEPLVLAFIRAGGAEVETGSVGSSAAEVNSVDELNRKYREEAEKAKDAVAEKADEPEDEAKADE